MPEPGIETDAEVAGDDPEQQVPLRRLPVFRYGWEFPGNGSGWIPAPVGCVFVIQDIRFSLFRQIKKNNQYPVFDREMLLISRYWSVSFRYAGQFARVPPFGLPVFANCVQ